MLKWSVIVFTLAVWVLGGIYGGLSEGTYIGANETTTISTLASFNIVDITWYLIVPIPHIHTEWFSALWTTMLWDFSIFENPTGQIIKLFFLSFTVATIIGFAMWIANLVRGN